MSLVANGRPSQQLLRSCFRWSGHDHPVHAPVRRPFTNSVEWRVVSLRQLSSSYCCPA